MTTLIGKDAFDYLNHLDSEIGRLRSQEPDNVSHRAFAEAISLERRVLEIHSSITDPTLSINPNGLPSLQTLLPDLEMALKEFPPRNAKEAKFEYTPTGFNFSTTFVDTDKKTYEKIVKNHRESRTRLKSRYSIGETPDKKIVVTTQDEIYVNGYDDFSVNVPIAFRRTDTEYSVVWNKLISSSKVSYFEPKKQEETAIKNVELQTLGNMALTAGAVAKLGYLFAEYTFVLPTKMRRASNGFDSKISIPILGFLTSFILNMSIYVYAKNYYQTGVIFNDMNDQKLGPEFFGAIIATNALSALYEWYRYERKETARDTNLKIEADASPKGLIENR